MDEEDFRIKVRPEPKELRPGPSALLRLVRNHALLETEDYLIRDEVAVSVGATRPDVGHCLSLLVEEGILSGPRLVPKDEEHRYRGYTVTWNGKMWAIVGLQPWTRPKLRRDPRQTPSKKEMAEYDRKHPPTDSGWDGRAYPVVRGKAFTAAARAAGLPEDPTADWTCKCGAPNRFDKSNCSGCYAKRDEKPAVPGSPEPKPLICERCGAVMDMRRRRGKKLHPDHGLRKCNVQLVQRIMED